MNTFDERWRACANTSRQALKADQSDTAPPVGFAARTVALARNAAPPADTDASDPLAVVLWQRQLFRALVGVSAVLLVLLALDYRGGQPSGIGMPHIERTVSEAFWLL